MGVRDELDEACAPEEDVDPADAVPATDDEWAWGKSGLSSSFWADGRRWVMADGERARERSARNGAKNDRPLADVDGAGAGGDDGE